MRLMLRDGANRPLPEQVERKTWREEDVIWKVTDPELVYKEAFILSITDHPNIPKFKRIATTAEGEIAMSSEFIEGENLWEYLRLERGIWRSVPIFKNETIRILSKLSEVLLALHDRGILYCDFAPQHIIINPERGACLIDMDSCKFAMPNGLYHNYELSGTWEFMAPEEFVPLSQMSDKSNVYSLGVWGLQMVLGYNPFSLSEHGEEKDANPLLAQAKIHRDFIFNPYDHIASTDLAGLIQASIEKNPENRPSLQEFKSVVASL